jgi:hypothetical protein
MLSGPSVSIGMLLIWSRINQKTCLEAIVAANLLIKRRRPYFQYGRTSAFQVLVAIKFERCWLSRPKFCVW